jgi:putative membrane protein
VAVQTASGSAGAEMTIEGIRNPEALRDYLYSQMRGAKDEREPSEAGAEEQHTDDEALVLLKEIRDAVRRLASQRGGEERIS